MVSNTIHYLHSTHTNLHLLQVPITFPTSSATIISLVEQAIKQVEMEGGREGEGGKKKRVRLAVFSHVTSVPSIVLPAKRLAEVCKEHGVLSLIDGAHAPGMLERGREGREREGGESCCANYLLLGSIALDMKDIGADFCIFFCFANFLFCSLLLFFSLFRFVASLFTLRFHFVLFFQ
jgi:hypothetical protein